MTERVTHTAQEYTVVILALTESGEKVKLCQIEMPQNNPGKFLATTRSFAVLKGVIDLAGEMIIDAETIYIRDMQNEKTHGG